MKRIVIALSVFMFSSALCLAHTEMADTTNTGKSRISEVENLFETIDEAKSYNTNKDRSELDLLSHFGYTRLHIDAEFIKDVYGPSHEWFMNLATVKWNLGSRFSLQAGFDVRWNTIKARSERVFYSDDANPGHVIVKTINNSGFKSCESKIRVLSYSAPVTMEFVLAKIAAGAFKLRAGCEFSHNNPGTIITKGENWDKSYTKGKTKKCATVNEFSLDYLVSVSLGSAGVYFKYCPKNLLTDIGSREMCYFSDSYTALGLILYL